MMNIAWAAKERKRVHLERAWGKRRGTGPIVRARVLTAPATRRPCLRASPAAAPRLQRHDPALPDRRPDERL
ncbi:MAG: hypothetical protein MZU95_01520 [Desulfomicrobium escambiense]|nr:hypothetical protein [Desulfomicrobium escambiense]